MAWVLTWQCLPQSLSVYLCAPENGCSQRGMAAGHRREAWKVCPSFAKVLCPFFPSCTLKAISGERPGPWSLRNGHYNLKESRMKSGSDFIVMGRQSNGLSGERPSQRAHTEGGIHLGSEESIGVPGL